MQLKVEKLKDEQIGRCLEIYNWYIKNTCYTFEEEELTLDRFTERCRHITGKYPFMVCLDGDEVIGYAYLDKFGERSAYRISADYSVYVDKDKRGMGAGKLLTEEILKIVPEGITNIYALISSENPGSVKFHEKNGFVFEGKLTDVGYKMGKYCSILYYKRKV